MILHATHLQGGAIGPVKRPRHVGMKLRSNDGREQPFTVLRSEDKVDEDSGQGLRHGLQRIELTVILSHYRIGRNRSDHGVLADPWWSRIAALQAAGFRPAQHTQGYALG